MKYIGLLTLVLLMVSCKKYESPYKQVPDPIDTTQWQDSYTYGGVLPSGSNSQNNIINTTWVLTKMVTGYSTTYPNDTITFISSSSYVLNQNGQRPYTISQITGSTNKSLTLYYFYPFGGSSYAGQVGYYFVQDGFMNNIEFVNLQDNTSVIRAWFKKI